MQPCPRSSALQTDSVCVLRLKRQLPLHYLPRYLCFHTCFISTQIPTFRAQPLQPDCDKWCWFPVADRANAVQQWINAAEQDMSMVKGAWLLLLETDYVWIKPLPVSRVCRKALQMKTSPPAGSEFDAAAHTFLVVPTVDHWEVCQVCLTLAFIRYSACELLYSDRFLLVTGGFRPNSDVFLQ